MARRKSRTKTKIKYVTRSRTAKRSKKTKSPFSNILKGISKPLSAIGYGYVREMASDSLNKLDIVKRLPATQFTDEGVMLGAMFLAKKLGVGKIPILNNVVKYGEVIEYARIGETLRSIQLEKKQIGTTGNNNMLSLNVM